MIDIERLAREAGRWASNQTGDTYEWNLMRDERFAALVRNEVLEEAAKASGEYAKKWWSRHSATNKHMTTTREAHEDFCALQSHIRALKEKE